MRAIFNSLTDPYFNIASDEYIIDFSEGDVFTLWRNSPAVIIGKNQNTWAEVDRSFIEERGIAVVRRITGGGAVYHDLGNINFSFVTKADDSTKLNFEKFTAPVIRALARFGIDASLDGRNDIVAGGRKISGNAECVKKNSRGESMLLHHGTLLFSSDLSVLSGALNPDPRKMKSRGIASVSSRVANIRELDGYRGPDSADEFMTALFSEIAPGGTESFSKSETEEIGRLKAEKFSRWEWNWGASPSFETEKTERFPFGTVTVMITCRGGAIEAIKFYGDFFGTEDVGLLESLLVSVKYERSAVMSALTNAGDAAARCISGASCREIADLVAG